MHLLIVVQLLHSVQALPDGSDKLGPVSSLFKLNDAQTGLASAKKKRLAIKLRNRSTSSILQKTVSISEVILQSTFSRTVASLSKQKKSERSLP